MSKERELLERAYQYIPLSSVTSQEIRDFLSTPEPTQDEEPVAWMYPDDLERFETNETFAQAYSIKCGSPSQGTTEPLYRHPALRPEFVRLSEEEIMDLWFECAKRRPPESVIVFARAIEDALEEKNRG